VSSAAAAPSRQGHRALIALSMASARELLRNGKAFYGLTAIFFLFLIIVIGMNYALNENRAAPVVAMVSTSGSSSSLAEKLIDEHIDVIATANSNALPPSVNTLVSVGEDRVTVVLNAKVPPRWLGVFRAAEAAGYDPQKIKVARSDGTQEGDILRGNLGPVLVTGLLAIAFAGTSVPIAAMRKYGVLRLLGTTPLSRLTFVLAQSPVRFLLGVAEAAVILAVAGFQGYLHQLAVVRLPITFLLGLGMLFAFAYLLGSRTSNPDLLLQVSGVLPVVALFASGAFLPLSSLPEAVRIALQLLPTTWFMEGISADVVGIEPFLPVYVLWCLMGFTGVAVALLSSKVFKWDQGDL
jgi:ABC-2 type transport system permease protein